MGLDVFAVTKYKVIEDPKISEVDDLSSFYTNGFDHQFGDLTDGDYYEVLECGDFRYHIGYGRHSVFREWLAEVAGYKAHEFEDPNYLDPDYDQKSYNYRNPRAAGMIIDGASYDDDFAAIIHFSDCEGFICNSVCKTISGAFEKYKGNVVGHDFESKYNDLAGVFNEASESGGFVVFG